MAAADPGPRWLRSESRLGRFAPLAPQPTITRWLRCERSERSGASLETSPRRTRWTGGLLAEHLGRAGGVPVLMIMEPPPDDVHRASYGSSSGRRGGRISVGAIRGVRVVAVVALAGLALLPAKHERRDARAGARTRPGHRSRGSGSWNASSSSPAVSAALTASTTISLIDAMIPTTRNGSAISSRLARVVRTANSSSTTMNTSSSVSSISSATESALGAEQIHDVPGRVDQHRHRGDPEQHRDAHVDHGLRDLEHRVPDPGARRDFAISSCCSRSGLFTVSSQDHARPPRRARATAWASGVIGPSVDRTWRTHVERSRALVVVAVARDAGGRGRSRRVAPRTRRADSVHADPVHPVEHDLLLDLAGRGRDRWHAGCRVRDDCA